MALASVKPNSGNRTPGSSDERWGSRNEYKNAARKHRRAEAKRDIDSGKWEDTWDGPVAVWEDNGVSLAEALEFNRIVSRS